MAKIIGYMRCPVCGVKTDIRENKNGILYSNCHNYHQSKMARFDSEEAKHNLTAGKTWNNGVLYLYPLEKQQTERTENNGNINTNTRTDSNTPEIGRRVDGQFTTNTAVGNDATSTSATNGDEWDGECGMF